MKPDPLIAQIAVRQWQAATPNQKAVVRFGMIPKEWHDELIREMGAGWDWGRQHSLALFDCANADGGMRA